MTDDQETGMRDSLNVREFLDGELRRRGVSGGVFVVRDEAYELARSATRGKSSAARMICTHMQRILWKGRQP